MIAGYGRCEKSWGGRRKNVGKGKKKNIPPFVQHHGCVGGLRILFTENNIPQSHHRVYECCIFCFRKRLVSVLR